jgi:hypothetical protein
MINIHLNGDIVKCPDIRAIKRELLNSYEKNGICKYNIIENDCRVWQDSLINWQGTIRTMCSGRCKLSGSILCSEHNKRVQTGLKEKHFKIDNQVYRKLASSAHYLVKESDHKTLFLTLTFPKFRKKHKLTKYIFENEIINTYFSRFVENLRSHYDCGGYIAVREFGKKTNRIHFHILLSIPFIPFATLNSVWCNCIKDICFNSRRAVTSDPKTKFVRDPIRAMKYVCKYFSKCKGQESIGRLVFVSNNILQKPRGMYESSEYGFLDSFKFDYQKQTSDFTTCYRITDQKEFKRFCDNFLYPFFELSFKKPQYLYSFPLNTS